MSTPLYIKQTTLDKIANSRIQEGCALLFYLDGKLKMKFPDGTIKDASGGADIGSFVITRPISDEQLYPKFEASATKDFTTSISVDPLNNSTDSQYLQVFDGINWIDFPTDGLGTPFDRMEVSVDVSKFENLTQPYYIRYCWVMSDGTESNFRSALFPSVSVSGSSSGESGGSTVVDNALAYEDVTDLVDGKMVPLQGGFPIWLLSPNQNLYPVEKDTMILEDGVYKITASKYLGYEGESIFTGTWRVYFAGGVKGDKGEPGQALDANYIDISTVTDGYLVISTDTIPVSVEINNAVYPVLGMVKEGDTFKIPTAQILATANLAEYSGTWRVWRAGGKQGKQGKQGERGGNFPIMLVSTLPNSPDAQTLYLIPEE